MAREWSQEEALLADGTLLEELPLAKSLDLCGLMMVHHGPNWAYPRHLHPVSPDWKFPANGPLDPSFDDLSDFSDFRPEHVPADLELPSQPRHREHPVQSGAEDSEDLLPYGGKRPETGGSEEPPPLQGIQGRYY